MTRGRFLSDRRAAAVRGLLLALAAAVVLNCCDRCVGATRTQRRPNIIFVMADDLGYGDLGCYGQKLIQTPCLDQMAREGMRFTDFYAGCTVCAPSRSVLMTGLHTGHTHVRGNASTDISIQSLRDQDVTVAELLHNAGYATALCGKWGLGDDTPGNEGLPNDQGFDFFYGYLNQVHAHNYYPEFLWRNREKVPLRNVVERTGSGYGGFVGGYATQRLDYSHDLIMNAALQFIHDQRQQPFFLYLALTIPHANNERTGAQGDGQEVPDYGIYTDRSWPDAAKGQAAMISRMDADMGRLLKMLADLHIDQQTVVMFTSDNGPHREGGYDIQLFQPAGPLRGTKRDMFEGGIRVPLIVRWPGTTPAGTVSPHVGYFGDLMATVAELASCPCPDGLDSLSFAPTITGHPQQQRQAEYLYWEFYEQGSKQAVRAGKWKAIRTPMLTGRTQLYDLSQDLSEQDDLATEYPDVVARLEGMMNQAHAPHPNWPVL